MSDLITDVLLSEYETIISDVGDDATDTQIIAALVLHAEWTEPGAREVLRLARKHGTSILRNALALASAMQIEDGEAGL